MADDTQFETRVRRLAEALKRSHGESYATKWLASVRTLRERWVLYHVASASNMSKQKNF